jgi:hypothetical protein
MSCKKASIGSSQTMILVSSSNVSSPKFKGDWDLTHYATTRALGLIMDVVAMASPRPWASNGPALTSSILPHPRRVGPIQLLSG